MTGSLDRRLGKLSTIWPVACDACRRRLAVVGVEPGEPNPVYPERCPSCGRRLAPVCVVVGVDVGRI